MNKRRRDFLTKAGAVGLGLAAAALPARRAAAEEGYRRITPTEELMRHHGVINRLMGIYEECARRLDAGEELPAGTVINAAAVADEFVESFHEALEEQFVYPVFMEASSHRELVATLVRQHAVGRRLIARTIGMAGRDEPAPEELSGICTAYARMYRAHAAHEDTVLMAYLRHLVRPAEFDELGAQFRGFARDTLGPGGVDAALGRVNAIEQELGIAELDHFTAEV